MISTYSLSSGKASQTPLLLLCLAMQQLWTRSSAFATFVASTLLPPPPHTGQEGGFADYIDKT